MITATASGLDLLGLPGEWVGIILGWALGVLTPGLTWRTLRVRKSNELKAALNAEMSEARVTFVMEAHELEERKGPLSDQFLDWEIASLNETPGVDSKVAQYVAGLVKLRAMPPTQRPGPRSPDGLIKPHPLLLAEANLTRLGMLPLAFQQRLTNVLQRVRYWNDDARLLEHHFDKTFDPSISGANRQILEANIKSLRAKLVRMARTLADDIGAALKADV